MGLATRELVSIPIASLADPEEDGREGGLVVDGEAGVDVERIIASSVQSGHGGWWVARGGNSSISNQS